MDDVRCVGNETSIANCPHRGWGSHGCVHQQDVSVSCGSIAVQYGRLNPITTVVQEHYSDLVEVICAFALLAFFLRLAQNKFCIFSDPRDLVDGRY